MTSVQGQVFTPSWHAEQKVCRDEFSLTLPNFFLGMACSVDVLLTLPNVRQCLSSTSTTHLHKPTDQQPRYKLAPSKCPFTWELGRIMGLWLATMENELKSLNWGLGQNVKDKCESLTKNFLLNLELGGTRVCTISNGLSCHDTWKRLHTKKSLHWQA